MKKYILKIKDKKGNKYDVIHPKTRRPCIFDNEEEMNSFIEKYKSFILKDDSFELDFEIVNKRKKKKKVN